jgi:hypothetical protein
MQDQIGGIAGLETLEVLQPLSWHEDCEDYSPDELPEF